MTMAPLSFNGIARFRADDQALGNCATCNQIGHKPASGNRAPALSSTVKLAVPGVGQRPKNDAGVLIYGLTKVHGESENNDKKEEIDAKERMQ